MVKAKILVVDDDRDMCWVVASILKEKGHSIDISHDGISALAKVNRHRYEVMILDYKLSNLSGLTVLERVRRLRPFIKIIMISAFGNESVRRKAKELGAYDFLDKPFDIDRLVRIVEKALKERRRRCVDERDLRSRHTFSSNSCFGFPRLCSGEARSR